MSEFETGRSGNEILLTSLSQMRSEGDRRKISLTRLATMVMGRDQPLAYGINNEPYLAGRLSPLSQYCVFHRTIRDVRCYQLGASRSDHARGRCRSSTAKLPPPFSTAGRNHPFWYLLVTSAWSTKRNGFDNKPARIDSPKPGFDHSSWAVNIAPT